MNLKQMFSGLFAAAVMFGASVVAQEAEKSEWMPEFSFSAKYASRYMSKGLIYNPESMMMYDASMSLNGFYAGVWVAWDQNDWNRDSKIIYDPEEIDYYVGYAYTFEELPVVNSLSLNFCYTYFDYPHRSKWKQNGSSYEDYALYANLGVMFNPGIAICYNPKQEKWYGNLNASWGYNFKDEGLEALTFNTGVEAWWGNNVYVYGTDGYEHHDNDLAWVTFCWNVSFDYAICDNVTLSPFATLAWVVDPVCREGWKGQGNPNAASGCNTLWGVKLAFNF